MWKSGSLKNYKPKNPKKRKFKETKDFLTVKDWKSSHQFGQLVHLKRTCLTMYLLEFSIISKKGWSSFWLTGSSVVKTNAQIDRFSTLIKVQFLFPQHIVVIQFPGNSGPPKKCFQKNPKNEFEVHLHAVSN